MAHNTAEAAVPHPLPIVEASNVDCCNHRRSSKASLVPNSVVRGCTNRVAITYGNRLQQAQAHLNGVAPNGANLILPFVNKSMVDVLMEIMDALRMLFVAVIPSVILTNKTLGSNSSRPKDHVAKSKGNIAAQIIKIFSFGLGCQYRSLSFALSHTESATTAIFVHAAVAFVCGRLQSAEYNVNIQPHCVMSYVWGNFTKIFTVVQFVVFGVCSTCRISLPVDT